MADKKISALTSASTPLAGTEVLPIVQSGTTVKVAVSDLTAARAVGTAALTATGIISTSDVTDASNTTTASLKTAGGLAVVKKTYFGDNIVQGTAAKGIDFSANTPLAGKTTQLLGLYEEGTWTPNQGGGLTVVGAFSSAGKYVRIGNMVYVNFYVAGATSVAATGGTNISTNLPYTVGGTRPFPVGIASNGSNNVTVAVEGFNLLVVTSGAIAATAYIYVSMTYFAG